MFSASLVHTIRINSTLCVLALKLFVVWPINKKKPRVRIAFAKRAHQLDITRGVCDTIHLKISTESNRTDNVSLAVPLLLLVVYTTAAAAVVDCRRRSRRFVVLFLPISCWYRNYEWVCVSLVHVVLGNWHSKCYTTILLFRLSFSLLLSLTSSLLDNGRIARWMECFSTISSQPASQQSHTHCNLSFTLTLGLFSHTHTHSTHGGPKTNTFPPKRMRARACLRHQIQQQYERCNIRVLFYFFFLIWNIDGLALAHIHTHVRSVSPCIAM